MKSGLTHTVTHTAKCPKSGGENNCVILSAVLYFFAIFSHQLRHEIAHLFCCTFLHLARDVGVGAKGKPCVKVTEHTGYRFHVYAILQRQRCECVPLRYNNDKQKKPLFSRGLSVCRLLFNSFSKLKIDENYKEKRRLFY